MNTILAIENLHVQVEDKLILKGIDLKINQGEIHVIMGPNGAGKSTLVNAIMGHPKYKQTKGVLWFEGENINETAVTDRARKGIFLSFQYPEELEGVTIEHFLRTTEMARSKENVRLVPFRKKLLEKMEALTMKPEDKDRYLNVGFSGGEKKKSEVLQMTMINPKLALLDETDSGLDVDATKIVAKGVKDIANSSNAFIVVTHHNRMLESIVPDFVHVLIDGKIVATGGMEVAKHIEAYGYSKYLEEGGQKDENQGK